MASVYTVSPLASVHTEIHGSSLFNLSFGVGTYRDTWLQSMQLLLQRRSLFYMLAFVDNVSGPASKTRARCCVSLRGFLSYVRQHVELSLLSGTFLIHGRGSNIHETNIYKLLLDCSSVGAFVMGFPMHLWGLAFIPCMPLRPAHYVLVLTMPCVLSEFLSI